MPLTAKFVATAKPGKFHDRDGLMLHVRASGSRSWVWRGTLNGRRVDRGIGNTRVVTLREARDIALEYRRAAYRGVDLGAQAGASRAPQRADAARDRRGDTRSPPGDVETRQPQRDALEGII